MEIFMFHHQIIFTNNRKLLKAMSFYSVIAVCYKFIVALFLQRYKLVYRYKWLFCFQFNTGTIYI